mmetsp:Transcript_48546/g.155290  ORF Transcript_48546/g.155290 Transcript_48546/m.155290 type:complete len:82 (+) Transcript_48546:687-932(+)
MFNAVGDAVVCPGNSFGFMDGVGVDLECLQRFGSGPVSEIQEKIRTDHECALRDPQDPRATLWEWPPGQVDFRIVPACPWD